VTIRFFAVVEDYYAGGVFGITENGWMDVFLKEAMSGDLICVFDYITPFVIRPALAHQSSQGKARISD
jgi:hypothetical protein